MQLQDLRVSFFYSKNKKTKKTSANQPHAILTRLSYIVLKIDINKILLPYDWSVSGSHSD